MSSWYTEDMGALHIKMPTNADIIVNSFYDFIDRVGKNKDVAFIMSRKTFVQIRKFTLANGDYLWNIFENQPYFIDVPVYFANYLEDIVLTTRNLILIPKTGGKELTPLICHICNAPLPETLKCDYCNTIHYMK
jgi:hypothetical protein